MKFKTPYNQRDVVSVGEVNNEPSQTVPDQSMSMSEILRRFAKGLPLGNEQVPLYEGEDDLFNGINPKTLDLAEMQALREDAAAELEQISINLQNKKDQAAFKKKLKELEEKQKFDVNDLEDKNDSSDSKAAQP